MNSLSPTALVQAPAPAAGGGAIFDGQGFPPREAGTPTQFPAPDEGGSSLLHSPFASHVQMNHFRGRTPTWNPISRRRHGCHGPQASPPARTRFRVCTGTQPPPRAHWTGDSRSGRRLDKALNVAVKFSASLKGPAFPVLDGADLPGPLGKFS